MATRMDLQLKLEEILGSGNVYFQPPESLKLKYPAIIYSHAGYKKKNADNGGYLVFKRYSVTLVYGSAEKEDVVQKLLALPRCEHNRHFVAANLNHDVFSLYF